MGGLEEVWSFLTDVADGLPPAYAVGAWVLTTVFAWSGIAKLRDPGTAATALVNFGVTSSHSLRSGRVLGGLELLLAAALAATSSRANAPALAATAAATALLFVFAFLIARSLRRGDDFACHCFGQSEDRLSRWTLARTSGFVLLAGTLIALNLTADFAAGAETLVLSACAGVAAVGASALISRVRDLVVWNRRFWEPG